MVQEPLTGKRGRQGGDESEETLLTAEQVTWKRIMTFFLHKFDTIDQHMLVNDVKMNPLDDKGVDNFLVALQAYNELTALSFVVNEQDIAIVQLEQITDWPLIESVQENNILKELANRLNKLIQLLRKGNKAFNQAAAVQIIHEATKKMPLCSVVKRSFEELIRVDAEITAQAAANTHMDLEAIFRKLNVWCEVYSKVFEFVAFENKGEAKLCADQLTQAARGWEFLNDALKKAENLNWFSRLIAGARHIVQMPLTEPPVEE
jgi:hypothetical protein